MNASDPRRWWALGALAVALLAFGLDVTVLSVALPTLAVDLHASTSQLQWFSNAYTLVLAAGLLPAGLLGDRFGPKRLLLGALALFGLASVACAYSGSAALLIASRALLGVGGAFLVPMSVSVLSVLFPGKDRARAIAVWAAAMALGIPLGPVVGGWLLDNFWWGSAFLVNVPFIVVGMALLARLLPDIPGNPRQRIDFPGIVLSSLGLVALTYGLVEAGDRGWGSGRSLVPIFAGVVLLAAFAGRLGRARDPLVDPKLFASNGFRWGAVLATLASFALMGAMFVLPQYFQAVFGTDALGTGLRLLPVVGGLLAGVQIADRIRPRLGAKVVVGFGFVLLAVGLGVGAGTGVGTGYGFVAVWVSLVGLGLGFSLPPAMDIALGALSPARSGVGSGLLQALRQVGGTLGVAILGTVLNAGYRGALPAGTPDAARESAAAGVRVPGLAEAAQRAFVHGMSGTLWVCMAFSVLGAALTVAFLPRAAEDVEAESGHEFVAG
ncbi:DHA2 family efflux MFS transporter permease subunit [Amycolatopsis alkalitolerans]|uniref:DHA2 family efflux MFS transporter permease subunit n=1 Tax=Amycolatopsis alkalitolerans TaxID=2547244 RepID=A0A5C4LWU2_9PSEU|nr:DHA2 family efflux MFS transporter permease subunit [Amycolatopsis alkalitolerans]TNC22902.1 DHA2 family efflux MFS transporter permease subunit [Amycolatopsis alkalitolerans]